MSQRKDIKRIYNKIDSILRKGKTSKYQYLSFINECISNGEYNILQDVLVVHYNIDARKYTSTDEMGRKTFQLLLDTTIPSDTKKLKTLFDKNKVYSIGYHFFDSTNSRYLGDIIEVEKPSNTIWYKDPKLTIAQSESGVNIDSLNYTGYGQIKIIDLEVIRGLTPSVLECIPVFNTNPKTTISYGTSSLVIWDNSIYKCISPYIWNSNNIISPTYSEYWEIANSPTYSYTLIDSDTTPLEQKYQQGIAILKQTTY